MTPSCLVFKNGAFQRLPYFVGWQETERECQMKAGIISLPRYREPKVIVPRVAVRGKVTGNLGASAGCKLKMANARIVCFNA